MAFFDFGASARTLPNGRVATSSEQRMRFMAPLSFGWRMRDQAPACERRRVAAYRFPSSDDSIASAETGTLIGTETIGAVHSQCLRWVDAVEKRRFPVGASPTRQT